ncbi:MAG: hypothetical protein F083_2568 [bacterium F083]|nr:MAG: hypothetical protein F083_2568 [bacterium F083]
MVDEYLGFVRFMIIEEAEEETRNYITTNYAQILDEERSKNAVVQLDKNGNVIRDFYSFNEICQAFNVPRADNVRNVLNDKQKSAYGYFWKYSMEAKDGLPLPRLRASEWHW